MLLKVLGVVILLILIWFIAVSNTINRMNVKIKESDSCIDAALARRYDTLTKMLDVCRNYSIHEANTFNSIINLRQGMSMNEKNAAAASMDEMKRNLNVIAEAYPQLNSNQLFVELQKAILDVEDNLQAARRLHNSNVSIYNQQICQFPYSIVASIKGCREAEFFLCEDFKRQDVSMKF